MSYRVQQLIRVYIRRSLAWCSLMLIVLPTDMIYGQNISPLTKYTHPIDYSPEQYVVYEISSPLEIDGKLTDAAWVDIPWTDDFVDIQGSIRPAPSLQTAAKMCWDSNYFYVAAKMVEPHIWAKLTERDAIMYFDDDFEIFIDPDHDGHRYFEFEMNAHNAIWDLLMLYPYYIDDQRNHIMNWDIKGIKTAVNIDGTLNDPADIDSFWSVEIAIPWETFADFKIGKARPEIGERWRLNFSRVDWQMESIDGEYHKRKSDQGNILPESNWVWSPTGYINMHIPETWGYIQFEKDRASNFVKSVDQELRWAMWQVYYQLRDCRKKQSKCNADNIMIPSIDGEALDVKIENTSKGFLISHKSSYDNTYYLNHRARIWIE